MTSELKSATARANGAKSRGPKTRETREKSSRNAITHGFTARKTTVLECENDEQFHEMLSDYVATYQPGSPVERNLVDEMAAAKWRMLRLRLIEVALFDSEMSRKHLPTGPQPEPADPGYQLALAFRRLADESRVLELASRYESRLHRIHDRCHRTLRELQQARIEQTAEPIPSPAPAEPEPPPATAEEPASVPKLGGEPLGSAMLCPNSRTTSLRSIKKSRNEPTTAPKRVQRRAIARHRGIMSYIRSEGFRCLRQIKAA